MIRNRTKAAALAALLTAGTALWTPLAEPSHGSAAPPEVHDAEAVDPEWWDAALAGIAQAEYHASPSDGGLQAPNRAQNLRTSFLEGAIEVQPRTDASSTLPWRFGWRTAAWGRAGDLRDVSFAPPEAEGRRVTYPGTHLSEWYENREEGLEQGFTVHERAPGHGPLRVEGETTGGLRTELLPDGSIDFIDANEARVLNYGHLHVWDATGRELSSWLEVEPDRVAIVVDDHAAKYPLTIDPLLSSPVLTRNGGQANALFGSRLATAGDVNGDGHSDVIVGAYGFDAGQVDEGLVTVFHGTANGIVGFGSWMFQSDQAGAHLGTGVACAGDVNGDGYDDVIVGASRYNGSAGRAYVFHGSASGLTASEVWTYGSGQSGANLGWDVAGAGDVNGDGYDDVIVGALLFDGAFQNAGRALVFHGSATGLATSPSWTVDGNDTGGQFGTSVATAGDVNGDGYDDIVIGAYVYDGGETDEGRAFVYHGGPGGLSTTSAWSREGDEADAWFGYSVSTAGDVNGDGYSDVLVGAPHKNGGSIVDSGEAYLFYGSPFGLGDVVWTGGTSRVGAEYGWSVATAGDANGDGFADFVVGAPQWYSAFGQTEGIVLIFTGSASGPVGGGNAVGTQDGARFGHCVATAGDTNGDGFSDILIGAQLHEYFYTNEGRAILYFGEAGDLSATANWSAQGSGAFEFGSSVALAGDVNGDGYSDVIVGAPRFDNGETNEGKAFLYAGSPDGLGPVAQWSWESDQAGALLGSSVASAGDVNGDGYADVIVGAPRYDGTATSEGAAFVYLGSPAGPGAAPATVLAGGQSGSYFGASVASAGDVNGDGFADLVVGAFDFDNGQNGAGAAYAYLGSASGVLAGLAWSVVSDQGSAAFGYSVASAGDVNGDGYSDVIVGAPLYDGALVSEGAVFVYHGSATGLSPTSDWAEESGQSSAGFGTAVSSAGDTNGDGFSDIIIGAYTYSNGEESEGTAFAYLGSANGLSMIPSWSAESNQSFALLGWSVSCAGDVNGDGYSDVIVGAPFYDAGIGQRGMVSLYHGSSASLLASAAWSAVGSLGDRLGTAVAGAGDVNGDGFSDILAGGPSSPSGFGSASLYLGGGLSGLARVPRQERTDASAPVALLGRSDSLDGFRISAHCASPAGRSRVLLEVEVKPAGTPFDGLGTALTPVTDAGLTGISLAHLVTGLQAETPYRWRARVVDDSPLFPPSRWVSPPGNGITETDLRTDSPATAAPAAGPWPHRVAGLRLAPPSPNPSRGSTELHFTLPADGAVTLGVYDLAGRRVALPVNGFRTSGAHTLLWDGTNHSGRRVASGAYFARLSFGGQTETRKIVRVR